MDSVNCIKTYRKTLVNRKSFVPSEIQSFVKYYEDRILVVKKDVLVAFDLNAPKEEYERKKNFLGREWESFLRWEQRRKLS